MQEHKSKLEAVEREMNFYVTAQIAEKINSMLFNHYSDPRTDHEYVAGISEAIRVTNVELVPMYAGTGAWSLKGSKHVYHDTYLYGCQARTIGHSEPVFAFEYDQ